MALHEQCVGRTDEWYTPSYIFESMGVCFDLDVAHPGRNIIDWIPATRIIIADSLSAEWHGFVWMNPPFGGRNGLVPWLDKFMQHGNGIALVPDRTSAPWFQKYAVKASSLLFVNGKIKFIGSNGKSGNSPAQGTCLLAAGKRGDEALSNAAYNNLGLWLQHK